MKVFVDQTPLLDAIRTTETPAVAAVMRRSRSAIAAAISPPVNPLGTTDYKRYVNSVVIADTVRRATKEALS